MLQVIPLNTMVHSTVLPGYMAATSGNKDACDPVFNADVREVPVSPEPLPHLTATLC